MVEGFVLFITDDDILTDSAGPIITRLNPAAAMKAAHSDLVAYLRPDSAVEIIKNRVGTVGVIG